MTCGEFQERFADYLSDSLEEEQKKALDDHLAACGECLGQFELMKSVWRELGELPDAEPSPALRSRFYSMLAREKQRIEERPSFADRFVFLDAVLAYIEVLPYCFDGVGFKGQIGSNERV